MAPGSVGSASLAPGSSSIPPPGTSLLHPPSSHISNANAAGSASSVSKSNVLQQKTSDTFAAFRKAAQEKENRERALKEQQESMLRMKKEAEAKGGEPSRSPAQAATPSAPSTPAAPAPPAQVAPSPAELAKMERDRQRQREQERRRREASANQIDMNMQSDLMAAFEENII